MYTLMKSVEPSLGKRAGGFSAYRQEEVAQYPSFMEGLAACDRANERSTTRYYLMNELGEEYYAHNWIA